MKIAITTVQFMAKRSLAVLTMGIIGLICPNSSLKYIFMAKISSCLGYRFIFNDFFRCSLTIVRPFQYPWCHPYHQRYAR
jgi:hypothetical protein